MISNKTIQMAVIAIAASFVSQCGSAEAELKSEPIVYSQGDEQFEGYLAYDENQSGPVPGVLLIHEWTGLGDYVESRADQFADMGYVAFAMDMYGKGVRAADHSEAEELMTKYTNDRDLMVSRMETAMKILTSQPNVDPERIIIVGYCFGGNAAIEYALSGADVAGVVTFHAVLGSPNIANASQIQAPIQIHHGAADAFIAEEDLEQFKSDLDAANVDYEFIAYEDAMHGFTRPSADMPDMGIAYDAEADAKSWENMLRFLSETIQS